MRRDAGVVRLMVERSNVVGLKPPMHHPLGAGWDRFEEGDGGVKHRGCWGGIVR